MNFLLFVKMSLFVTTKKNPFRIDNKVESPMGVKVINTQGIVETKSLFNDEYPRVQLLANSS